MHFTSPWCGLTGQAKGKVRNKQRKAIQHDEKTTLDFQGRLRAGYTSLAHSFLQNPYQFFSFYRMAAFSHQDKMWLV